MLVDLVSAAQKEDWAELRNVLYKHWLKTCPKLYSINNEQPWDNTGFNEKLINEQLFVPLVSAFCIDSQNSDSTLNGLNKLAGTDPTKKTGQMCGHVFKNGELTYTCMDCAQDGTCVMCLECFEASIHKNHKYRLHPSSGSGYCDCGDIDAWSDGYACSNHTKNDEESHKIPEELLLRTRKIVDIILIYCINLITQQDDAALPKDIESVKAELNRDVTTAPQYLTVLYNDETHTYESVIKVLELYIHCTKDQAMLVATLVDREGRSAVKLGSKNECTKAKDDFQRKKSGSTVIRRSVDRSLPLAVKVMDTELFAHQNHAISLLNWLNIQMDVFPSLREIVGEAMLAQLNETEKEIVIEENVTSMEEGQEQIEVKVEEESEESIENMEVDEESTCPQKSEAKTLLETILLKDTEMWKSARSLLHQMLMKTVFMNYEQKVKFSKTFIQHYDKIYQYFIDDDHDMDISVVGLSVQFLTVPALARQLIAEDDAFSVIIKTLISHTNKYIKEESKRFDFMGRSFPTELKRSLNISRDMAYLLNAVPSSDGWSPELRTNFIKGLKHFLNFLHHLQGMDEVKRQAGEHQIWESEWETAFNILLRMKDVISLIILWTNTNKDVHNEILLLCLEEMDQHPITSTDENGGTHIVVEVETVSATLRNFDVLRGGVSIHQPIVRLIAGLFSSPDFVQFLKGQTENEMEVKIRNRVKLLGKDFYEMSLRVLVLCAQSVAQLWRRNGFSLVNQIHNYFSPLCRSEMFDRDILMIQVGCAITPPVDFLLHLLQRFRLAQWAETSFEGFVKQGRLDNTKMDTEDLSKITVTLAEEFLQLIIMIVGERFAPGVGKCPSMSGLQREVVHVLCTGSQTFSHIQHKMSHDVPSKRISLHEAVNAVADFRKPLATSAGQFYLKNDCLNQFNPFFMHYSKSDQSQAEQHQTKIRSKMDKSIRACIPPKLPEFNTFFERIPDILRNPLIIRILRLIIDRTTKRNRFSSDRLFHKALFIVGMALNEEETNPEEFNFTGIAEDTCGLIEALEGLQGKQESSICHLLLDEIILKYKRLRGLRAGTSKEETTEKIEKPNNETVEEAKLRRAAKAAEMRKKAMSKMTNMQTKFMKQIEEVERKEDQTTSNTNEQTNVGKVDFYGKSDYDEDIVRAIGTDFPVCIGANRWKAEIISERKLTCILCQEDEPVHPTNGKPMVCAAFIQQSQLFTHKNRNGELMTSTSTSISPKDLLTAPATLQYGVDVSTCSHSMHFECYKTMFEANKNRESLRARQQHGSHKMVEPEEGEYLCPLCKRLSNAAIPILPATQITPIRGFSTVSGAINEEFDDWVARVKRQLDMPCSNENIRKKGHSRKRSHSERSLLDLEKQAQKDEETTTPSAGLLALVTPHSETDPAGIVEMVVRNVENDATNEFYNELAAMFLDQDPIANSVSPINTPEATPIGGTTPRSNESTPDKKPLSAQIQHALHTLIRPFPGLVNSNRLCGNGLEQYEESIKELGKNMIKFRKKGNESKTKFIEKHLKGYVIATVTWQSAAHVARAISSYLHYDGKPLFGALNTRHRDCLSAMARLCSSLSHNLQFLQNAISDMLRILCCEPPVASSSSVSSTIPQSPPAGAPSTSTSTPSNSSTNVTANFTFLMQLFNLGGPKKNANLNILQVDILSLAISLMMSIGWTWHNGNQLLNTVGNQKQRQLAPDGSVDEAYVLRLSLLAHYFQIFATYEENDGNDVQMTEENEEVVSELDAQTNQLLTKLFFFCRPYESRPRRMDLLYKRLEEGAQNLLRPIALIYHFLTLIDPPEALKDPSINSSEPLFRYLSLPSKIEEQISGSLVENLFSMWSHAIPRDSFSRQEIVVQPVRPNLLVDLPLKYSQLINQVSTFRCPSIPIEESTSNVPTICLVCGQVLCSQAYCCQRIIDKQTYGACRYHMSQCSGSVGIFLRVRDCNLVLMTTRKRGCFRPAPYVDEFGESDQGFRRGNPLQLNKGLYQKLKQLWLQQGVTEEVVNYNEIDFRNHQYDWGHF